MPEAIPGSTWAMLDAVAGGGSTSPDRSWTGSSTRRRCPVVIVQLHRRLRELLVVADLVAEGRRPPEIVKAIGGQPFKVQKLVEQARRWTLPELDDALEGVLELDAMIKGAADSRLDPSARCASHSPCGCPIGRGPARPPTPRTAG